MHPARDDGAARAETPTIPSRRSLLATTTAALAAGAASFVKPPPLPWRSGPRPAPMPGGDAELIAAAEQYLAAHALLHSWDTSQIELTEEQSRAAIASQYDAIRRITEITPVTAAGQRAKLQVAHLAMESLGEFELSHEEELARSVLAEMVGGRTAA